MPTAVATYLLIKQSSKSIDFAAKEILGSVYQATNIFDLQNLAAAHEAAVAPIATAIKLNPELETSLGDKLETFNNNFTVALEALKGYESARTKSGPELQV